MIAEPPSEAGALKVTSAEVVLGVVAVPIVGAPGVVRGVTETDDEADESPAEFTAFKVIE